MNPLHPQPILSFWSSPDPSDDVEMLQTDVMRFFAILCLCLTAIFALVKALPVAPPDAAPTIVEPALDDAARITCRSRWAEAIARARTPAG